MDKKFESFRSKVSTSDILAIPDPESMELDQENSQFNDRKCANENIEKFEKSVITTPTRHGGRVTRSRTPKGKKVTDNTPKVPNMSTDKSATPKRPVTPSQDGEAVRLTRSKTPKKSTPNKTEKETENKLTTPKRAAKQTPSKTTGYVKLLLFVII